MIVTGCSIVMGGGLRRVVIASTAAPVIRHDFCDVVVWVDTFPSSIDGCMSLSDDIDLSGLISPPPDATGSFPIIVDI